MPRLTIITVNFNHLDGLLRTIESVVNQTFTDYEWIVVDGGSTDGSRELLEQYKNHFAWWCSEPDTGVYNAMNKGLSHAAGEYVNFMNSGDMFATPIILEEIFSKRHTASVLYGLMMRENINGVVFHPSMMKPNLRWFDFFNCTLCHQSTFTKREMFEKYGSFDESFRAYADWRHFAQMIAIGKESTEFIPKKISIYEGGGISETDDVLCRNELMRIRADVYPNISDEEYRDLQKFDLVYRLRFSTFCIKILCRINAKIIRIKHRYGEFI